MLWHKILSIFDELAINKMIQRKEKNSDRSHDEMKAVSGLLEVAQKKTYLEDWHEGQSFKLSISLQTKNIDKNNKVEKVKGRAGVLSKSLQRVNRQVKIQQSANNQQESLMLEKQLPSISDKKHEDMISRRPFYQKFTSFRSHLTFYQSQKNSKDCINSSLTFYGKQNSKEKSRYPQEVKRQSDNFLVQQMNSSKVYFKTNKAETIRELLKQMRISKEKSSSIVLTSTQHEKLTDFQLQNQPKFQSLHQGSQLRKHHKFIPLRDECPRLKQSENVWKKKFKQSWQKRKFDLEERNNDFKRLIVKD